MGSTDTSRSINFALIGHAGDGKTTLADSLLLAAGVVALTVGVGLWSSVDLFRRTPLDALRNE